MVKISLTDSDRYELGFTMINECIIKLAKQFKIKDFKCLLKYNNIAAISSQYYLVIDSDIKHKVSNLATLINSDKFLVGLNNFTDIKRTRQRGVRKGSSSMVLDFITIHTFLYKNKSIDLSEEDYGESWFLVDKKYL